MSNFLTDVAELTGGAATTAPAPPAPAATAPIGEPAPNPPQPPSSNGQEPKQTPATPAPTPTEDYSEFGVKSRDELKSKWENYSKLEKQIESDTYTKKWLEASSKGISKDNFDLAYGIDLKKMSAVEKVALKLQLENGYKTEDTEFLVSRDYRLEDEYDPNSDDPSKNDPDVRASRIKLEQDAKAAEKYLEQFVVDATTPPAEKVMKQWGDASKQVLQEASKIVYALDEKTGITFSASDKPDVMKQLKETVESILSFPGFNLKPDEEGKAFLANAVRSRLMQLQSKELIDHVVKERDAIMKARELAGQVNPSALGSGEPRPNNLTDRDSKLAKQMGDAFFGAPKTN